MVPYVLSGVLNTRLDARSLVGIAERRSSYAFAILEQVLTVAQDVLLMLHEGRSQNSI